MANLEVDIMVISVGTRIGLRLVETIYRSVIDGDWWLESGCDILVWN
jgi:hypothetical protein